MSEIAREDADLFQSLGFKWDRSAVPTNVPIHDVSRACFRLKKMLAQYVWDASVLEGNPFTYPQVKTILDGITVGGHKLSDHDQVRNLAEGTKALLELVKKGEFALDKKTFLFIHAIVARKKLLSGEASEVKEKKRITRPMSASVRQMTTCLRRQKTAHLFSIRYFPMGWII